MSARAPLHRDTARDSPPLINYLKGAVTEAPARQLCSPPSRSQPSLLFLCATTRGP